MDAPRAARSDPAELTHSWLARDGRPVVLRALSPEDLERELEFVAGLSAETRYLRLQYATAGMSREMASGLLELDYHDRLAIAGTATDAGHERIVGVCRYAREPGATTAEFAIVVADDWQGTGLGTELMRSLCHAARARGVRLVIGETLSTNRRFIDWARSFGCAVEIEPDAGLARVTLDLDGPKAPP